MSEPKSLPEPFGGILDELLEVGAIQFGLHELKAHRTNKALRLSEYYFNCRGMSHPGGKGKVPPELIERIATLMVGSTIDVDDVDCIVAVPDGATPYAEALGRLLILPVVRLTKRAFEDGTTRVDGIEGGPSAFEGKRRALLVEDVVTSGASSMEAADVLGPHGVEVTDALCVVDRQQGGYERFNARGITLRSLFTFRVILDHAFAKGKILEPKYQTCIAYHAESQNL